MKALARTPPSSSWASAFYFLHYAAGAAFWPFQVLYYQERGLSGGQIGLITAVSTLVSLWAAPLWAGIADAKSRHRAVFVGTTIGAAGFLALITQTGQIWLLLAFVSGFALTSAALVPLMDDSVVAMLGTQSDRYGRIRLWGSIGWGLAAPTAGLFIQVNGLAWGYWMGAGVLILSLAASVGVPFARPVRPQSYWKEARTLLADRRWWFFLFLTFVAGIGMAGYGNYLFPYMEGLGASKGFMGLAETVATVAELPVFFFAGLFLRRFHARSLLTVALGAIGLRCLLYWVFNTAWAVLPIQLLHGLTFSLLWSAGVSFARENAPPGLGATAQGLFGAMVWGIGGAAGGLLGGVLLGSVGARSMFGIFALITFVGLAAFLLGERWTTARRGATLAR